MLDQSFSARRLLDLVQHSDVLKFQLWPRDADDSERLRVMQGISDQLNALGYVFPAFREKVRAGKVVYSAPDAASLLALRKVNQNLLRVYKVRQSDRNALIHQVRSLLQDACAYSVLRLDVASFYESVGRERLLRKLGNDAIVSHRSRVLLRRLFESPQFAGTAGVPRGLAVSATLSELYMRGIDRAMSMLPEVCFYGRYVDDIIMLTCGASDKVARLAEAAAKEIGLQLNAHKYRCVECLGAQDKTDENCLNFDFLGYNLRMREKPAKTHSWREVRVGMAESKKNKAKSRIARAFVAYSKNRDFALLERRLRFLSGNYPLKRDGTLRGGIYYSYQHIDHKEDLDELTLFMRRLTFARRGSIGKRIGPLLTRDQRARIVLLDFRAGFEQRRYHEYDRVDLDKIGECWLYEKN